MSITDSIADLLTRIRNGQRSRKQFVVSPYSREKSNILRVLCEEGYIRHYAVEKADNGMQSLRIELKYEDGQPVIRVIDRVSTPGRRAYSSIKDLPLVANGLGINILSTSQGVMSDAKARKASIGGEIICKVF